jgi:hypothetical protein
VAKIKKTGLGVDALFGTPVDEQVETNSQQARFQDADNLNRSDGSPAVEDHLLQETGPRSRQVRTSILFYEQDFRLLEDLRIKLRRSSGKSMSQSEIVREALRRFANQEGLSY